jgi:alpha-tubulin suppressor-like RCC1 family protein
MNTSALFSFLVLLIACNECAIGGTQPGRVIGWGFGGGQDLGHVTSDFRQYVTVEGVELTNIIAVAAYSHRAMALKGDGTVVVWGYVGADTPLLTVPTGLGNVTAIALAGDHNLALRADSTVVAWGYNPTSPVFEPRAVLPAGVSNVVAIAGAGLETLVLKRDGTIQRWGGPDRLPPAGLSNIVALACGVHFGDDLALRRDGIVVEWPTYFVPDPYTMPPGLTDVISIASGSAHALALKKDGTVVAWGFPRFDYMNPNDGQLDVPAGLSNVVAIAGGPSISLALKKNGTVVVWGDNHHHQVDLAAGLSNIEAVAAGYDFCLAIQTNSVGSVTNAINKTIPDK